MDASQQDARRAELERRSAALEVEIRFLRAENGRLKSQVRRLTERLAQYELEVRSEATSRDSTDTSSSCSLDAETRRRERRRRKKKSPGRQPTEVKFLDAQLYELIYPDGVRHDDCTLVRERAVWRLIDGKAVLAGYCIFAGPDGKEARIPGVTPRCEYGIEILVVLAYLAYIIGISLDKTCAVLDFFRALKISKSQADALLRQLAKHWEGEYETLCELIARAAVGRGARSCSRSCWSRRWSRPATAWRVSCGAQPRTARRVGRARRRRAPIVAVCL